MKNLNFFLLLALLVLASNSFSQQQVGQHYDINGQAIHGYLDPLSYAPEKKLSKVHYSDSYEMGHYYDSTGNKVEGFIKFENKKIYFKENMSPGRKKLTPDLVKNFVIGVDSFFVVSNYYWRGKLKTKPQFVQFITEFDGNTYAKLYQFKSSFEFDLFDNSGILEIFLIKEKGKMIWDEFPRNRDRFKSKALQYFGHIPYLKKKIQVDRYKFENTISLIKYAEYRSKAKNSQPVFFDEFWTETYRKEKAKYHANINQQNDSIWIFDYFKNEVKLYTAHFSSFYPNVKDGELIAYNIDGTVRQRIFYKNNKQKKVKNYKQNGSLLNCYQCKFVKKDSLNPWVKTITYDSLVNGSGNHILKENTNGSIQITDQYRNLKYNQIFRDNQLVASYRVENKDTIYQITDPNYKFRIKKLQTNLDYVLSDNNCDEAISKNAQGIILALIRINKKGHMVDCKILNKIHPQLDSMVHEFLLGDESIPNMTLNKFKPYKHNKKKQFCEFILPFEFSILRFYRKPTRYYYFNHFNHFNHFNTGPKFTPPPTPTFNNRF